PVRRSTIAKLSSPRPDDAHVPGTPVRKHVRRCGVHAPPSASLGPAISYTNLPEVESFLAGCDATEGSPSSDLLSGISRPVRPLMSAESAPCARVRRPHR